MKMRLVERKFYVTTNTTTSIAWRNIRIAGARGENVIFMRLTPQVHAHYGLHAPWHSPLMYLVTESTLTIFTCLTPTLLPKSEPRRGAKKIDWR